MASQKPPQVTQAHADAGWTLVRWFVIPIVLVAALYFVQRTLDERPFVVVTNHGPMMAPEEMAAAHPLQPQTPAPAPATPAPLTPATPGPTISSEEPIPGAEPQALSQPAPAYPPRALDAEKEGVVRLHLYVAPDGHVTHAKVLSAQPTGWFERAAEEGVKHWRYAPSEFGGTADVDVEFKLK
jgi:TonB family protein